MTRHDHGEPVLSAERARCARSAWTSGCRSELAVGDNLGSLEVTCRDQQFPLKPRELIVDDRDIVEVGRSSAEITHHPLAQWMKPREGYVARRRGLMPENTT